MANSINESFISAANAAGGAGQAVSDAAKNTAAVQSGGGFTEQDVVKAYQYASTTNKILEDKGILPKAREGKTDRAFFIQQGASAGVAIARLVATGGLDLSAWAQLGVALGQMIAGVVRTIQANEKEEKVIKQLYDIYPFWVMPCFKGNDNQKEGSFDFYGNEFINCATERDRSLLVLKILNKYGDDAFQLITTYAALIYGSSVRNGTSDMFVFGKYDFGTLNGDALQGSERNLIKKSVEKYKEDNRIKLQSNGDFQNAALETKINYIPQEKINAYAWTSAVRNAVYSLQFSKEDEIVFLKDLSAAIMLSDGITCDIAYKDVAYGLIGEMRYKIQNQQNKNSQKEANNSDMNKTYIFLGIAAAAVLVYFVWFRKK